MLVEADGTRVLIDAGIGPRNAVKRMRELGGDFYPRGVDAIVITHHHNDHAAHLEPHARAVRAPVYLHRGIDAPQVRSRYEVRTYEARAPFIVGGLTVEALVVPHDAPQVAIRVSSATHAFAVATDLGHVPRDLARFVGQCDAALVEANYCPELLRFSPYPPRLKARVAGGLGHLANEQTAELASKLRGSRLSRLYLGHISRSNNTPERALAAVRPRCVGFDVHAIPHGVPHAFDVTRGVVASASYMQLGLCF